MAACQHKSGCFWRPASSKLSVNHCLPAGFATQISGASGVKKAVFLALSGSACASTSDNGARSVPSAPHPWRKITIESISPFESSAIPSGRRKLPDRDTPEPMGTEWSIIVMESSSSFAFCPLCSTIMTRIRNYFSFLPYRRYRAVTSYA